MTPRCPRCESKDLVQSSEMLEASDESFKATHECTKCHTRFRFVPPDAPFNGIRLRADHKESR